MKEAEEIKRRERDTFDRIAEAYDKRQARYNALFASDMIDMLFPQKYDAGLDVAGVSSTAGLKLAERIGPEGSVTIIDISPARFCRNGSLERYLHEIGLQSVRRVCCAYPLEFDSFDDYWKTMMEANPGSGSGKSIPRHIIDAVREDLRGRLVHPRTGEVWLFNEAAIILARKPS